MWRRLWLKLIGTTQNTKRQSTCAYVIECAVYDTRTTITKHVAAYMLRFGYHICNLHGQLRDILQLFKCISHEHIEAETKMLPFHRRHFQMHFVEWKCMNSLKVLLNFVHKVRINNISALIQIMVWRRRGDKPLSELMMVSLLTHICLSELTT